MIELLAIFSLALLGSVLGLTGGSEDEPAPGEAEKGGTEERSADEADGSSERDDGTEDDDAKDDGAQADGADHAAAPGAPVALLRGDAAHAPGEPAYFDSFTAEGPEAEVIAIVQPSGGGDELVQPGNLHLLADPEAPGELSLVFDNGVERVTAATIAGAAGKLTADHVVFVEEG